MQDLTGKNAFVTGGASGIGFAMAQAFLNEGMNVAIADVDTEALAGQRPHCPAAMRGSSRCNST